MIKMMDADGLTNDTMLFYGRPTRAEKACINGNIYILKILYYFGPENFMRNKKLVYKASFYGHVHILEWLYSLTYEFQYDEYTILGITNLNVLKWYVQTFKDNLKYFKNLRQTFNRCNVKTNYKQFINMHYSYAAGLKLRCKTLLKNRRYCKNTIALLKLNNYNKIKKRYFKGYKKN